jgi:hypothetical protein
MTSQAAGVSTTFVRPIPTIVPNFEALETAVVAGDCARAILELVPYKALAEQTPNKLKELTVSAIDQHDIKMLRDLSIVQGDVNALMELTIGQCDTDMLRVLQKYEEHIRVEKNVRFRKLQHAVRMSNPDTTRQAIESGENVNQVTDCGETLLHIATSRSDLPMVQLLLAAKADVNARSYRWDMTPFQVCKSEDVRHALGAAGADPHPKKPGLPRCVQENTYSPALRNLMQTSQALLVACQKRSREEDSVDRAVGPDA